MTTTNEELADALIRHLIYLQRYSGQVRNKIFAMLERTEPEIARLISTRMTTTGLTSPADWKRYERLVADIAKLREVDWKQIGDVLAEDAVALAKYEAAYIAATATAASPVVLATVLPPAALLRSLALSQPFHGRVLRDWVAKLGEDDITRMRSAIQMGMLAGEDAAKITRRVLGTGTLNYVDGMTELTRKQTQTIIRTAVQHIANNARDQFWKENSGEVVVIETFIATLDSRTTPQCRALDGKQFKQGKGPIPPLHMNCRSVRSQSLDSKVMAERPANPTTEKMLVREFAEENNLGSVKSREDLPYGTKSKFDDFARKRKRELIGPVPSETTYQQFLSRQSVSFQNEVLGVTKARLFREGGLPLDRYVDRNGNELTLAQLAQREREAFIKAGLKPEDYLPKK